MNGKKLDRKDFLKLTGFAGLAGVGAFSGHSAPPSPANLQSGDRNSPADRTDRLLQQASMRGHAAPPLDRVRIGVIGLGSRGSGSVRRFTRVEGVEIRALCDLEPDRTERNRNWIRENIPGSDPRLYSGSEDAWRDLCEQEDLDLVIINTPWHLHAPQAILAMENGKHAGVEVPAAVTLEECWQLVETSERTRRHCMMLSNSCYGDFPLTILKMVREGFFGELIHAEGAYIHDLLRTHLFNPGQYHNMWRLRENTGRNGNLYPTHGLGPICLMMDINCGDRMEFMVSVSSDDFTMNETAKELAAEDPRFSEWVDADFRGNMNTSIIRTRMGRTIMLQHDVTSPRPGVRFDLISGTGGIAMARPPAIATSHDGWLPEEEFRSLLSSNMPEIIRRMGEMARQVGGHGGIDALMTWRLIDCLRNGLPLDMDVYDAALWSSIGPLSERSVEKGSMPVEVPDFTQGLWQSDVRGMDIDLQSGGNTRMI